MPLVNFREMLDDALAGGYIVGYFESWNLDSLESVLSAAEELKSPVIIGFGGMTVNQDWFKHGGLDYLAALGREAVRFSKVPVSFIINEVSFEECLRGMDSGFNVVMLDSGGLDFEENIKITKELVKIAHKRKVGVEAELGHLPENLEDKNLILTDPKKAETFVKETCIDALSVSIGNVHTLINEEATIDLKLLKEIRESVPIPLVIHGGSGFPKDRLKDCLKYGVAKFNVGTVLKKVYIDGIKGGITGLQEDFDVQSVVGSRKTTDFTYRGKQNIKEKVKEFIRLLGSAGRA